MADEEGKSDASSIKPVSSLRSRFEALNSAPPTAKPTPAPKPPKLTSGPSAPTTQQPTRTKLDTPRHTHSRSEIPHHDESPQPSRTSTNRRRAPSPPKARLISMVSIPSPNLTGQKSPETLLWGRVPPQLSVTSPTSSNSELHMPNGSPTRQTHLVPNRPRPAPPSPRGHGRRIGQVTDTLGGGPQKNILQALDLPAPMHRIEGRQAHKQQNTSTLLAIDRSGRPKVTAMNMDTESARARTAESSLSNGTRKVSPFNTPPSSDDGPSSGDETGSVFPPPVPLQSKPALSIPQVPAKSNFAPPPTNHTMAGKRRDGLKSETSSPQQSPRRSPQRIPAGRPRSHSLKSNVDDEAAPALPPRRSGPGNSLNSIAANSSGTYKPSALNLGFSSKGSSSQHAALTKSSQLAPPSQHKIRSRTPPAVAVANGRRSPQRKPITNAVPGAYHADDNNLTIPAFSDLSEYPDSSHANRRPPYYPDAPRNINVGYDTKLFAVCGDLVCATGLVTRVWSLLNGKLILSIPLGDTVRATALCFKPARKIEDDGRKIWLGTNLGDLLEVDIASKRTVATNAHAHNRREIVKLHQHGTEIWSLDEEGKLYVWPPDDTGTPNIAHGIANGRVPRRSTTSLVVGNDLWLTFGKDVRVIRPDSGSEIIGQQSSPQKAVQQAPGDITASALLNDQPDNVYLAQSDGKISVFSSKDYECLQTVSVSLYKISCLVGIGSYLWSGHSTGVMFVYDPSTQPWTVKKDWSGHEATVYGITAERNSLWKLNRLPVVSLGSSELRIWDGMLQDDWLEHDMHKHELEYCDFRELRSLILTWNVGATTPFDMRYDEEDSNCFRDLLGTKTPPDIVAFGLQELVDLEDKKLTAKNFFKSKHKDVYGQEHLSSTYRAWRDHLSRCLDEYTSIAEPYALVHTASLVGLFTCIFIKASLKPHVKDVEASEVKTGMGGLHGNKGAIVVRLILDDSSVCFVNCHLAAGQNQTMSRNNDIASILETTPLSSVPVPKNKTEIFANGGDGSMILDSESCILNGDLNYRIDTMSRDTVVSSIEQKKLAKLLERDQLLMSKRKQPGFRLRNFREGRIDFAPTYKYDVGTDTYDSSEKRRAPAWCDRILYRGNVEQLDYQRHEVRISDHRPVSSRFIIKVKTIRQESRAQCRTASVQRFEAAKRSVSDRAKLDYLHDVFGLSSQEGLKLLKN